jgi:hypothetical protein
MVWLAPSGQREVERGALPLCIPCAERSMSEDDNPTVELVPGAAEEFFAELKRRRERN